MNSQAHSRPLAGKRVAIVAGTGFELLELTEPRKALDDAGAETVVIAPAAGTIKAWNMTNWDLDYPVDMAMPEAAHEEFDALHLPGGPLNADILRGDAFAIFFIKEFFWKRGKPISALCHAPWLLVEADILKGKTVTSYQVIATDLRNAGATWVNAPVVRDGLLVTGRHPADTPEFNPVMVDLFAEAKGSSAKRAAAAA